MHYYVDGYGPACGTYLKDRIRATRHLDSVTCKRCLRVANQSQKDPKWVRLLGPMPDRTPPAPPGGVPRDEDSRLTSTTLTKA